MLNLMGLSLVPWLLAASSSVCPNTGATMFFKTPDGIIGAHLLGPDSYQSLFVGGSFRKADSDPPPAGGRAEFSLGRVMVQWQLVGRGSFKPPKKGDERAILKAFQEYEVQYLKKVSKTNGLPETAIQSFDPVELKGADEKTRWFQIWKAAMGKNREATQYWVASVHPQGVMELSLIATSPEDEAQAQEIIDSYMANYSPVSAASCKVVRDEVARQSPPSK